MPEALVKVDIAVLDAWLINFGWSQTELASESGVPSRSISRLFESGAIGRKNYGLILDAVRSCASVRGFDVPSTLEAGRAKMPDDTLSGNNSGGLVVAVKVEVEIRFPELDFDPEMAGVVTQRVSQAIHEAISLKRHENGSVKLFYELTEEQAEIVQDAIRNGLLDDVGKAEVKWRKVNTATEESPLNTPIDNRTSGRRRDTTTISDGLDKRGSLGIGTDKEPEEGLAAEQASKPGYVSEYDKFISSIDPSNITSEDIKKYRRLMAGSIQKYIRKKKKTISERIKDIIMRIKQLLRLDK